MKQQVWLVAIGGVLLGFLAGPGMDPPLPARATTGQVEQAALPRRLPHLGAQAAPSISIAAPSAAIGDLGAWQGNVWDMDSTGDIAWTQPNASGQTIQLSQPSAGIVRGRVPEGSDLAIAFYADSSTNLPSSQYHHLTYRLKIAAEGNCQTNGRVIYTKSWPNWLGSQVFTRGFLPDTNPMNCLFGQWCIYYMDLSSNSNDIVGPDYATWFTSPPPWPNDRVMAFGMWPHERWANCGGGPDYFDLDFAYLTGDIVAREKDDYNYSIKWYVSDPDGGSITSEIRYKEAPELVAPSASPVCNNANFGTEWTYIAQVTTTLPPTPSYPHKTYLPLVVKKTSEGSAPFNVSYSWDLSGPAFQDGLSYYVCIRVSDGGSSQYAVSSAPVIRVPHSPNFGSN